MYPSMVLELLYQLQLRSHPVSVITRPPLLIVQPRQHGTSSGPSALYSLDSPAPLVVPYCDLLHLLHLARTDHPALLACVANAWSQHEEQQQQQTGGSGGSGRYKLYLTAEIADTLQRLGRSWRSKRASRSSGASSRLSKGWSPHHSSDPALAAEAILKAIEDMVSLQMLTSSQAQQLQTLLYRGDLALMNSFASFAAVLSRQDERHDDAKHDDLDDAVDGSDPVQLAFEQLCTAWQMLASIEDQRVLQQVLCTGITHVRHMTHLDSAHS